MFWRKKKPCYHEWKVSDFILSTNYMGDSDKYYELICTQCSKRRLMGEYEFSLMEDRGLIVK